MGGMGGRRGRRGRGGRGGRIQRIRGSEGLNLRNPFLWGPRPGRTDGRGTDHGSADMSFVFSSELHFNSRLGKPEFENLAGQALYCLSAFREVEKQWNILQRPSTNAPECEHTAYRLFRYKIAQTSENELRKYIKQLSSVRNGRKSQKMSCASSAEPMR